MTPITYEQFGQQFIRQAVTPERIQRELAALLAEPIKGSVAKLRAEILAGDYQFTLKSVEVEPDSEPPEEVRFRMRVNGTLALKVKIVGLPLRFTLDVHIRIAQRVKTYAPAIIRLENQDITREDVSLDIDAHDVPGDLLDKLNIIEPVVRDQMVDEVNARIRSGDIAEACTIDVVRLAQNATLGATAPVPAPVEGAAP